MISTSSSLDEIGNIGKIGYKLSCLSLFIRSYDLSIKNNIEPYYNLTQILSTIDDIESLKNELDSIQNNLEYCDSSQMIENNLISEYSLLEMKSFKKKNLIDLLTKTITYVIFN